MSSQFENLERLRQDLETNIQALKVSLRYWQTWEYEYEGFKEELERPLEDPSTEQMLEIGLEQESEVVNEREIKALLNYNKQPSRTRSQVIAQIRGRIDTGEKNVSLVRKQLSAAEEKLDKVLAVTEDAQDVQDTEGTEPQMDIFEQLDDEDNVISSQVVNASQDRAQLQEVLKGNGLGVSRSKEPKPGKSQQTPEQHATPVAGKSRKVVETPETGTPGALLAPAPNKMHPTQRMLVLDHNDNIIDSKPLELVHASQDTSNGDEAAMMAHMSEARANAREIAPIVASFDIEPDSDSDMDMDTDNDDDESESDENEYGMSDISSELTDDYKAQMEALMQKHAIAMENAGPTFDPDVLRKLETAHRDAGLVPKTTKQDEAPLPKKALGGKGVRFAEELDISASPSKPEPSSGASVTSTHAENVPNPVAEAVTERTVQSAIAETRAPTTRKPSRFKTSMNTASNRMPESDQLLSESSADAAVPSVIAHGGTSSSDRPKKMSRFKAASMNS